VERSADLGQTAPWLRVGDEIAGDDTPKEVTVPADGPRQFIRVGARE
jgi:hypothetical protein